MYQLAEKEIEKLDIIDLSRNESFIGPSPKVTDSIVGFEKAIAKYPCVTGKSLQAVLAKHHEVDENEIVIGNGSVGLLEITMRALLSPGDEVILPASTFSVIPDVIRNAGGCPVPIGFKNWLLDLESMLASVTPRTRMIVIVNPNNPTGTFIDRSTLLDFISRIPKHVNILIDEAYIDYVDQEDEFKGMISKVKDLKNMIVTRTFSKAHGLAALRVGYCVAPEKIAMRIQSHRMPFTNNPMALKAAALSIKDETFLEKVRKLNSLGLYQLSRGLDSLGLTYIPSVANFISIYFGDSTLRIAQELKSRGVLAAPQCLANMSNHLRVSVGHEYQNEAFLYHLSQIDVSEHKWEQTYEIV